MSTETSSPTQSGYSRVGIIAGATVAVISLLLVSLALVFFYQRKKLQKIWGDIPTRGHCGGGRRERKGLLEDDDLDDHLNSARVGVGITNDGGRNLATANGDTDERQSQMNPTSWGFRSTRSLDLQPSLSSFYSSQRSTSSISLSHPAQDSSIRSFSTSSLYHVRPPGSGSVFREEGIWPPPGEVTDPFAGREEMRDVGKRGLEMGNAATRLSSSAFEDSPLRSSFSQTTAGFTDSVNRDAAMANRGHQIIATGSATSVIGDVGNDLAIDLSSSSSSLPPLSAAFGMVKVRRTPQELKSKSTPLKSILKMESSSSSGGGSSGDRTDLDDSGARTKSLDVIPSHYTTTTVPTTVAPAIATAHRFAPFLKNLSQFQLHNRSSTVGTTKSYTSESIYSTETADAAVESGYVSFGSTPPPPPPGLSFTPLPFHHRPSVLPPARTLQSTLDGLPFVGVTTPTKSSTTVPGLPIFSYDKQSTSSSFYSQVSGATTTTATNTGVSGGSLYSQESAAAHATPVGISNRDMKVGLTEVDEFGGKTI